VRERAGRARPRHVAPAQWLRVRGLGRRVPLLPV
jgi:hypothetical protein